MCFPRIKYNIKTVKFEAMYWRKANAIHKWFVDNVQSGEDDCGTYDVSREQLQELQNTIMEALKDKKKKVLPTKEGFFFGGTDYDDDYWDDLKRTVKELKELLADKNLEGFDFQYNSSW